VRKASVLGSLVVRCSETDPRVDVAVKGVLGVVGDVAVDDIEDEEEEVD